MRVAFSSMDRQDADSIAVPSILIVRIESRRLRCTMFTGLVLVAKPSVDPEMVLGFEECYKKFENGL